MVLKKGADEDINAFFRRIRTEGYRPKDEYQGISIEDVERTLHAIDRYTLNRRDAVWSLLNNEFPSLFSHAQGRTLADGASVAQIGGYIGIVMRGQNRLDREGRDYWLKPLREIGAIVEVTFLSNSNVFVPGHIKPKSPNSAYRLDESFRNLLRLSKTLHFHQQLEEWISEETRRKRLSVHAAHVTESIRTSGVGEHRSLIGAAKNVYAPSFLPGYYVVFEDSGDGDRITAAEKAALERHGVELDLSDAWPDLILVHDTDKSLWFIEAVTSDGEIDGHKLQGLRRICEKSGKSFGGATTVYATWKRLAQRQGFVKNLARETYVWLQEDPEKVFKVL